MDLRIAQVLQNFRAVQPANSAAMHHKAHRRDQRYILDATQLRPVLNDLQSDFDLLAICGKRVIFQATQYVTSQSVLEKASPMVVPQFPCAVRIRHSSHASSALLEVRLQDSNAATVTRQLRLDDAPDQMITKSQSFIHQCHVDMYGAPPSRPFQHTLTAYYERATLVSRSGTERLTIDTRLDFVASGRQVALSPEVFLLQVKSAGGTSSADTFLQDRSIVPKPNSSKFLIGVAALRQSLVPASISATISPLRVVEVA